MPASRTALLVLALSILSNPQNAAAFEPLLVPEPTMRLTIEGGFDSTIWSSPTSSGRESSWEIYGWSHEIKSPRDVASGFPTGKRQHMPFVVTKQIDHSTPLFAQALVQNETIEKIRLEVRPPAASGHERHHYTIVLENATVAGIRYDTQAVGGVAEDMKHETREHVSFTYQRIIHEWTRGADQFQVEDPHEVSFHELLGGSGEPEADGQLPIAEPDTFAGGNCSNICTDVVACCVCKCFESSSWPFNYGCAAGCLVLDTVLGDDDDGDAFAFASPDGRTPLAEALLGDRRATVAVRVEAGVFSLRQGEFGEDPEVALVFFEMTDVHGYLEEVGGGERAEWLYAGPGEPTGATYVADLRIDDLPEGAYLVRAVFVFDDRSTADSVAVLAIR